MIDLKQEIAKTLAVYCRLSVLAFLIMGIISCGPHSAPAPDISNTLPTQIVRIHKVAYNNENLSMIALWYTGNAKNWNILSTYNGHLRSASQLAIGNLIRIPSELMIRTDPMSADFVSEQAARLRRLKKKTVATKQPETHEAIPSDTQEDQVVSDEELNEFANTAVQTPAPVNSSQDQLIENLLP